MGVPAFLRRKLPKAPTVSFLTPILLFSILMVTPVVDGEFVRFDVTEDQAGVPTYLDIELLDVNTCEPVANTYIDIWACNATGVYSGVG